MTNAKNSMSHNSQLLNLKLPVCEVKLTRLNIQRCLVCYKTNIFGILDQAKGKWNCDRIAEGLCKLWTLPVHPYEDKLRQTVYCKQCYEQVLNISTILRKISDLQAKLYEGQCKIEEEIIKSHKSYLLKTKDSKKESKYNFSSPWDEIRKKIITDLDIGSIFQPDIQLEDEDSEDRAFLEWAESNTSGDKKNVSEKNIIVHDAKPAVKKQPIVFAQPEPLTFSRSTSPGALSDSDIFNEMIETNQNTEPKNFHQTDTVSNEYSKEMISETVKQINKNLLGEENISDFITNQFNEVKEDSTNAENSNSNFVPHIPCTVFGCRKRFKTLLLLEGHTKKFHLGIEKPYMCNICGHTFSICQDLKNHETTHFPERPQMCQYCGKRFKIERYLKIHLRLHTGGPRHKCNICDKEFTTNTQLREHMQIHIVEKGFICEICSEQFKTARKLRSHLVKHKNLPEKEIVCEFCPGKKFASARNLKTHMKRHNDDFDLRCPVCNLGCESESRLKTHMKSHSSDLSYFCDICDKGFKHKDSFNLHKKRHIMIANNDRPFQCTICDTVFLAERNLKRHLVLHERNGDKYPCNSCDQSFPVKHFLTAHIKKCHSANTTAISTGETPSMIDTAQEENVKCVEEMMPQQLFTNDFKYNLETQVPLSNQNSVLQMVNRQYVLQPIQQPINVDASTLSNNLQLEPSVQVILELEPTSKRQLNMAPSTNVNVESNFQPVLQQIPQHLTQVTMESMEPMQHVTLESMNQAQINLESIAQINLEPMRQMNLEPMTHYSLEPLTQVSLTHLGQINLDSMVELSRVNVGPMGEVNIQPLTRMNMPPGMSHLNLEGIPQISLDMENIPRIAMSQMNMESLGTINLEQINQVNIPPIDQVHLDSIVNPDIGENEDNNYYEPVTIEDNDNNQMVPPSSVSEPSSCMFETMDMANIGMEMGPIEMGPMEMEASPATTLMETLASYYSDI